MFVAKSFRPGRLFRRRIFLLWLLALVLAGAVTVHADPYKILVFSKTAGFRHDSITNGILAIQQLGVVNGFTADATEDATLFTDTNLTQYRAVVFLSTTGDVLDANQQAAFERYIRAGNGFVGIHAAADTEYSWPWYGGLMGAYFKIHPAIQTATVKVADRVHPSTATLPKLWSRNDEWYNFQTNPRGKVHVLATLDENSYAPGTNAMGFDHPTAWCQLYDGGRAWYTGGGHTAESYAEPFFLKHILGGIQFAAGAVACDCGATVETNYSKVVLDKNVANPMELSVANDGRVFFIERGGKLKIWKPETFSTVTAGQLAVFSQIEDGLLGLTLDPGFETNHWLYMFYSPAGAIPEQHLSRFTMVSNTLDLASEKVLLVIPTQRDECCHSGGSLTFGPDGSLYISVGDNTNPFDSAGYAPLDEQPGRSAWDSQKSASNANDLRGKILRIRPKANGTYTIPPGNLFPTNNPSTRPEIYIMGCRNPFRMSVDSVTGWLYWGEVGPDAGATNSLRGPAGHDEWNQAKSAGNYGWPYFTGNNFAYRDYDFATSNSFDFFDPLSPTNNSPNNTGPQVLPPARPAWIWYPYSDSTVFPEINGAGGRTAMGGPVYHYNATNPSPRKFSQYYDSTVFIYEWSRNFIKEVKLNDDGSILKINPFLPSFEFTRPIEMEFGPDGALYMIEWGTGFGGDNTNSQIIRIEYNATAHPPIAVASATPNSGGVPLQVQFSSAGSYDPDTNGPLSFVWSFFSDGATNSTAANPVFTYPQAGNYVARLRVTSAVGSIAVADLNIAVGNHRPVVTLTSPPAGAVFDWGKPIAFSVAAQDAEDGNSTNGTIACSRLTLASSLGHNDHAHSLSQFTGCTGYFAAPVNSDPDTDNLFLVAVGSYTDNGAPGVAPLTGSAVNVLQPRHKQAEFFSRQSGTMTLSTTDTNGGGLDVAFIDHGDWITINPMSLLNVTSIVCRAGGPGGGGRIEFHLDTTNGLLVGTATVPVLGTNYTNVTAAVADPGGSHELFLVFLKNPGDTGLFSLNYVDFRGAGVSLNRAPYNGVPRAVPGTVQAEDFDDGGEGVAYHDTDVANNGGKYRATSVDIESAGDTGGGYNIGWTYTGEWLEYTLNVATAGWYALDTRVASVTNGGTFHITIGGSNVTGTVTVPGTTNWQVYTTLTKTNVALKAGSQIMRVSLDTAGLSGNIGNLNYFRFTLTQTNQPPGVTLTNPVPGAQFFAPATIVLNATATDSDGSVSRVDFFKNGVLAGSDAVSPFALTLTNLGVGSYTFAASAVDNLATTNLSAPVAVSVVQPPLSATIADAQPVLRWPVGSVEYSVQYATNLHPPITWLPQPGTPASNGAWKTFTVTNAPATAARFYRLAWP